MWIILNGLVKTSKFTAAACSTVGGATSTVLLSRGRWQLPLISKIGIMKLFLVIVKLPVLIVVSYLKIHSCDACQSVAFTF